MKWLWTSLALAIFSSLAMGQQIKVGGRLITDEGKPVPNTTVRIAGESAHTDGNGRFTIHLSSKSREGERVVITVQKNWIINQPLDGEWTLPATGQKNLQLLDVIVVPYGSKALWTAARIEKELNNRVKGFAVDDIIQELARKYGSTPEITKDAFNEWAKTQNNIGDAVKEQSRRVEAPEAVRVLGEAVSAYQRALSVLTRESRPQEWATTQHNLGYALQAQGALAKGPEAIRLLGESVAAYGQALSIRTREQLPWQWAITQNDLGNALQGQGTRAEGREARRLLGEAATAYTEALLVFTRENLPQDWAMTQHNLGSALHEQGTRADGTEAQRLLGEAVMAYRQALLVRTREQVPQQWAITQNNLGNALQAQGTKSETREAMRLFAEALSAYRQALLVFTREQRPHLWAMTKHNVGSALQEQGTRAEAPEARRLFGEAVATYREALLVWTRERMPQQWAMAQNNLARAYFNLQDWISAAASYENVLEVYPEFRAAYERARSLEQEVIYNYQRAFELNQSWLKRNPDDLAAIADFVETHFTTGGFDECARRIAPVLSDNRIEEKIKIPVRALEIANLIALNRSAEVPRGMKNLIDAVERQQIDFRVQSSFTGIQHFISENPQFTAKRDWLLQLFAALRAENRDAILKKLRAATENFTPSNAERVRRLANPPKELRLQGTGN